MEFVVPAQCLYYTGHLIYWLLALITARRIYPFFYDKNMDKFELTFVAILPATLGVIWPVVVLAVVLRFLMSFNNVGGKRGES